MGRGGEGTCQTKVSHTAAPREEEQQEEIRALKWRNPQGKLEGVKAFELGNQHLIMQASWTNIENVEFTLRVT